MFVLPLQGLKHVRWFSALRIWPTIDALAGCVNFTISKRKRAEQERHFGRGGREWPGDDV
jgi:hypothetical protein